MINSWTFKFKCLRHPTKWWSLSRSECWMCKCAIQCCFSLLSAISFSLSQPSSCSHRCWAFDTAEGVWQDVPKSQRQRVIHTHIDRRTQIWFCLLCSTDGVWWSSLCTGADVHPLWNQTAVLPEPLQHWPRVHRYKTCTESYISIKCHILILHIWGNLNSLQVHVEALQFWVVKWLLLLKSDSNA